jgi:hypothetical protein
LINEIWNQISFQLSNAIQAYNDICIVYKNKLRKVRMSSKDQTSFQLKMILLNLTIIITMLLLMGCDPVVTDENNPENPPTPGSARIRFIHCASSTSELDLAYRDLSDSKLYLLQEKTSYGIQYGYYDLYSGEREMRLYQSYSDIAVAAVIATLEDDKKYTVIAYDYQATINPDLMVLPDTLTTPEAGMSYVRFIHTGTDLSSIRIAEQDSSTNLISLDHLAHSKYLNLQARTYKFTVQSTQTQTTVLAMEPITLLSEQCYSIIFSGSVSDLTPIDLNAQVFRETSL